MFRPRLLQEISREINAIKATPSSIFLDMVDTIVNDAVLAAIAFDVQLISMYEVIGLQWERPL